MIIAIDGPAGVGKSSAAKMLSKTLKIEYIDTGAMYRAFALKVLKTRCDYSNISEINTLLNTTKIDFNNGHILLDNLNVNSQIRTNEVSKISSIIATIKEVRIKLVEIQRTIVKNKDAVLDGRDIGTHVFPNANFKFFLTASPEARGKRRFLELSEKGINESVKNVINEIKKRDFNDSTRDISPLKPAKDAIIIDTTNKNLNQVVKLMTEIILEGNDAI